MVVAFIVITLLNKRREKRHINSYLVKNLFKETNILDFFDQNLTSKALGDDLDFIGLNITKKAYTTIKSYVSVLIPAIYILISFATMPHVNILHLSLYAIAIFLTLFIVTDIAIKFIAQLTQLNLRFEFIGFLGAWARNIELGANVIASLEKSTEIVKGTLQRQVIQLVSDIHASTPVDKAIIKFGQACRDKEIKDFCQSMAIDIKDGADITKYIVDTNKRIQNDKANIINANTKTWHVILSSLTGIIIFFSFATYLMLYTIQSLTQ